MNTKQQGNIGVAAAIAYYTNLGHTVSLPLGDSARYDLIVYSNHRLLRIQCKTTRYRTATGNYQAQLSTQGGNRSWNGIIKRLSKDDCDILFVYCMNGACYVFPPEVFDGRRTITLGHRYLGYKVACIDL